MSEERFPIDVSEFAVQREYATDRRSPLRWVLSHAARHKWQVTGLLVGAIGNAAVSALVPLLVGVAFEAIVGSEKPHYPRLMWAAVAVIVIQIARAGVMFMRSFSAEVIGQRMERDTRDELYASLIGKSMIFHNLRPVGDTMARATNDVREINFMLSPGINLALGSAAFLITPVLAAPIIHWQLIATPVGFLVTYVLALWQYLRELQPISERLRSTFGVMNARLAEAIDGIETVKGAAREPAEVDHFNERARAFRDAFVHQGRVEARFLPLLLLGLANAAGFWHAVSLAEAGEILLGDVVAYMGLLMLFGFPVFVSVFAYSKVSLGMAAARRILELMKAQTELDENPTGHAAEIEGAITFEDVTFGYDPNRRVLSSVSFHVDPGETVAIVGQTGAGKTTLVKLVNRIHDVHQGRVLVDGVDVRDWQLAALRQKISIIEQDVFLFSRTIADNIAFGRRGATRDEIKWAAHAAQAHEFIMAFKEGYQTVVGERGATLSGGQRQRIAIARAFLTRPAILILDDSTSAIDSATEDQIQRAIRHAARRQTTLLITHRLSQIRWADLIVVLRQGRVAAVGTHTELLDTSEDYRRIFSRYERP